MCLYEKDSFLAIRQPHDWVFLAYLLCVIFFELLFFAVEAIIKVL